MARMASLVAGNNFLTVFGGTRLLSINGGTSNNAMTIALYLGSVAGDVVAANLIHTFTTTTGDVEIAFVEGIDFGLPPGAEAGATNPGLIVVVTAGGSTFNLLAEYTAAKPEA